MTERMTSQQIKDKLTGFKTRADAGENVEPEAMAFLIDVAANAWDALINIEMHLANIAAYSQNADERARNALGQL